MSIAIADFWKLLIESRLLGAGEVPPLEAAFSRQSGSAQGNAPALAEWLISRGVVSRFQSKVLLAGQPGPFVFGEYRVVDRIKAGRLVGVLRGVDARSGDAVLLYFFDAKLTQSAAWPALAARLSAARKVAALKWRTLEILQVGRLTFAALDDLSGGPLTDGASPAQIGSAAQLAALARELASMHATGVVYGGVQPTSIWLDSAGNACWLPLSLVLDPAHFAQQTAADDVRNLARMVDRSRVPPHVGSLIDQALSDDPSARPSALQLAAAIESPQPAARPIAVASEPILAAAPPDNFAEAPAVPFRPGRKKSASPALAIGAVASVLIIALIVGLLNSPGSGTSAALPGGDGRPRSAAADASRSAADKPSEQAARSNTEQAGDRSAPPRNTVAKVAARPPKAAPPGIEEIDDDGRTLWTSPTAGPPLDLRFAPAGAQAFLILRPAELLGVDPGRRLLETLGPAAGAGLAQIQSVCGIAAEEMEELHVAFFIAADHRPNATFTVYLSKPIDTAEMLGRWQSPVPAPLPEVVNADDDAAAEQRPAADPGTSDAAQHQYYRGPRWSYWLPAQGGGRTLVVGPTALVPEIAADPNPPRRREMERLLRATDRQRHVTLLFAPRHLMADGRALLLPPLDRLQKPLEWFLGEAVQAASLSMHLDAELFLELRAIGSLDEDAKRLTQGLLERVGQLPERVESHIAQLNPQPYGRHVLLRFPRMIQAVADFARGEPLEKQAVVRCYLPAEAAHNLALGADLALWEGSGGSPGSVSAADPPAISAGPAAALAVRTSLSFPRDTLEKSLEMLAREINVPLEFLGSDLQIEGITRNKSFGLDERDKPAGEILRTILRLADPDGKLIYVIKPGAGGRETIFITTRAAAAKRGDSLPPELAAPEPTKP